MVLCIPPCVSFHYEVDELWRFFFFFFANFKQSCKCFLGFPPPLCTLSVSDLSGWRWLSSVCPIGYAFEALLINEFSDEDGIRPYIIEGSVSRCYIHFTSVVFD